MALRSKFLSTLSILAALAVFSLAAMAQDTTPATPGSPAPGTKGPHRGFGGPEGRRGPGGRDGMMMGELRDINLTDAQKQQIHTIMENNKPDQTQMEQMRTLMDAKRNGTLTADQEAQLKTFRQERMAKGKQIHDQIMAVLTPEQVQQVEQHKKEMKEHWEQKQQQAAPAPTKPSN
jgi:Spy/CpxP family protein refolding chaperone